MGATAAETLAKADASFRRALRLSLDLSKIEVDATRANHGGAMAEAAATTPPAAPTATAAGAAAAAAAAAGRGPGAGAGADAGDGKEASKGAVSARRELQLQQREALNTLLVELKFLEMDFDAVESATTKRQVQEDINLLKREIALKDKLVSQVVKDLSKWAARPGNDEGGEASGAVPRQTSSS
ncbi:Hypothetical Protein FCC1311_075442 [Hondaea fermentalgiana]|uniref:Uncharacterized protein n=1 Tax=Hondaea fermentalgiana TaxID=2315210 RepID=A0A2R5GSH4_9STRA|nr:Hypothetical Protein FCC1311_075442 [Hondaea fermentalgiana]|eukprot:GBG31321.1 Hypothetical Protein FCC1311_075442 [Hondaea fermentalgiana]